MNYKTEGTLAVIAAVAVLVSSLWNQQVAVVVGIVALLLFALNEFRKK